MAFGGLANHAKSLEKSIAKGVWNRKRLGTEFWTISGWIPGPFWHPKPTLNHSDFAIFLGRLPKQERCSKQETAHQRGPPSQEARVPGEGIKGRSKVD